MLALVVWVRDLLVAAALAWVGIAVEPAKDEAPCPNTVGGVAACQSGDLSLYLSDCREAH
jgi:hypothetical protein